MDGAVIFITDVPLAQRDTIEFVVHRAPVCTDLSTAFSALTQGVPEPVALVPSISA